MFYLDADKTKPLETLHVPAHPCKKRVRTNHKVIVDGKQYRVYAISFAINTGYYIIVGGREIQLY